MANPWTDKDGVVRKHMQRLARGMHHPAIRSECYSKNLITYDEETELSEMKKPDNNQALLRMLAGRGDLKTFITFREILRENAAMGFDDVIQDFDTVGNGGGPAASVGKPSLTSTAAASPTPRQHSSHVMDSKYSNIQDREGLEVKLMEKLDPAPTRKLARAVVKKYDGEVDDTPRIMQQFGKTLTSLPPGDKNEYNLHVILAYAVKISKGNITRQDVCELLSGDEVAPGSRDKFETLLRDAE